MSIEAAREARREAAVPERRSAATVRQAVLSLFGSGREVISMADIVAECGRAGAVFARTTIVELVRWELTAPEGLLEPARHGRYRGRGHGAQVAPASAVEATVAALTALHAEGIHEATRAQLLETLQRLGTAYSPRSLGAALEKLVNLEPPKVARSAGRYRLLP